MTTPDKKQEVESVTQDDVAAAPPEQDADEVAPAAQGVTIPQDAPVPPGTRLQPGQNDTRDQKGHG